MNSEVWLLIIDIWRTLFFKILPSIARRSNQSILMEISPEYSLEGKMLKLKLQYFGHLMRRTDSLEKTLMLGKMKAEGERDNRGWDGWMPSVTLDIGLSKLWELMMDRGAWSTAVHEVAKSWTRMSELNWKTTLF